jgi:hypothetical protein
MTDPEPKRSCIEDWCTASRLVSHIIGERNKIGAGLTAKDMVVRDLLSIVAREFFSEMLDDAPINLRETLDRVGLLEAVVLESFPNETPERSLSVCGNSRLNAILLGNNARMMQCTRFHALPHEKVWILFGFK